MTTRSATPTPDERYERVPLTAIFPSKTNPRTHFDEHYLAELAQSIAEKGIVQPILVRPNGRAGAYEIVAGECRFRASRIAAQEHIPAIIRTLTDEQVLELQLIENIHRRDLTPLEQARGYRALIDNNPTKHSAESIATRIGMSPQWVWDRMKLNDLVPAAKQLLDQDRMTVGHAILIARQKPEHQTRIIDPNAEALFEPLLHGLDFDGQRDPKEKPGKYDDVKAVSVRELEAWIARHIRFDVAHAAKAVPLQFEATAAQVQTAAAIPGRGKKVIPITFDDRPADDAKDPDERTYGWKSWRRADGTKKTQRVSGFSATRVDAPTCEYSVLGVVAVGDEHYGETFQVCVNRDKCRVHFGKAIAAREKAAKAGGRGKVSSAAKQQAAEDARRQRDEQQRRAREARWKVFVPALRKAVTDAVAKLPAVLPKAVFQKVLTAHRLPASTKPAQLQKALLEDAVTTTFRNGWSHDEPQMVAWAKLLGVDVKACEPAPPQTSGAPTAAKSKKTAKKGKAA